ncbi:MAG: response regulator [Balneolaceae bacterium]|nr:response regulator [Balneolaceae bacterium]
MSQKNEALVGMHILVAEDDKINQKVTRKILEREGAAVSVVSNGEEALKAVETDSFDLILMDLRMPVMNGFEATMAIRHRETLSEGERITIVALSASALNEDKQTCLEAGMDGYLTKPVRRAELVRMISNVRSPLIDEC